jgi:hypothetical protein
MQIPHHYRFWLAFERCPFEIEVHPPAAMSEVIRACGKCPIGVLADITTTTYVHVFQHFSSLYAGSIASYVAKSECDLYKDVEQ